MSNVSPKRDFNLVKADAKELGIKIHGKKTPVIEAEIAEKRAQLDAGGVNPIEGSTPDESNESPPTDETEKMEEEAQRLEAERVEKEVAEKAEAERVAKQEEADRLAEEKLEAEKEANKTPKKSTKPKFNAVEVYNGKMKVRTYSKEVHGPEFALKAMEFSEARKFKQVKIMAEAQIVCPHCGVPFAPRS